MELAARNAGYPNLSSFTKQAYAIPGALIGAGVGAGVGAMADADNRWRGAGVGAVAGAGIGGLAGHLHNPATWEGAVAHAAPAKAAVPAKVAPQVEQAVAQGAPNVSPMLGAEVRATPNMVPVGSPPRKANRAGYGSAERARTSSEPPVFREGSVLGRPSIPQGARSQSVAAPLQTTSQMTSSPLHKDIRAGAKFIEDGPDLTRSPVINGRATAAPAFREGTAIGAPSVPAGLVPAPAARFQFAETPGSLADLRVKLRNHT